MSKGTVTVIWCARCRAEHRKRPGKLGVVIYYPDGRIIWESRDERNRPVPADHPEWARTTLAWHAIASPHVSNLRVPDRVPAWCRHHGAGSLKVSVVLAARGNIVVDHQGHADSGR